MNIEQDKEIIISAINNALEGKAEIKEDMQLIGSESLLHSMKLVEVCLALEDLADEHGFEFDWTSEAAMRAYRQFGSRLAHHMARSRGPDRFYSEQTRYTSATGRACKGSSRIYAQPRPQVQCRANWMSLTEIGVRKIEN
jgi:hypothetical protein